jgi:hypothetical protein
MSTQYSNSSHVCCNYESSKLVLACEIRFRRDCGIGGLYTWAFTDPRRFTSHNLRSGDLGGPKIGYCWTCLSLLHSRRHFPVTLNGVLLVVDIRYYKIIANENFMSFPAVVELFRSCNRFENVTHIIYNSLLLLSLSVRLQLSSFDARAGKVV